MFCERNMSLLKEEIQSKYLVNKDFSLWCLGKAIHTDHTRSGVRSWRDLKHVISNGMIRKSDRASRYCAINQLCSNFNGWDHFVTKGDLLIYRYTDLLIHWSSEPLISWFSDPLIYSSTNLLIHWSNHPVIHWSTHPLICLCTDLIIYWSTHPLIYLSTDLLIHKSTHPLI